ncbi:MAG: tripartite tricarboxylate transporter substrate binding protein [Rhodoplanes sp.]|uniref:Bug family tripartite tricarboxylate transporter substrate binding protein n=1 Tax=Rhodoplanes sp. TaxID=1968906 RepID=UPI00180B4999|nr:tripartite tricarboxylate transporter substrate binding protein [Rhodoplanes sp.]NVO14397.1 tripartite tricarboxylate transporter substrate binding protein [Rhodoplanes sp.]
MFTPIRFFAALCAGLLLAAPSAFAADPYPSRPIRMIVAFAAGGSADINARVVAQQLAKELGGTIIIENKGGAGGNLGAVEVKRSAPDGYTIFYATSAAVLAPALYSKPGFDPYTDFVPISLTATIPLVLVVNPAVPAKTVADLAAWSKEKRGEVNYGSSGAGAILHLGGALFLKETGVQAAHVPYKGSAGAVSDLLGGSVQFMFLPINEAFPHIDSGGFRPLAVAHDQRLPLVPNVPTLREATGLSTMDMGAWQGLMVPKGTPSEITDKLTAAIGRVLNDRDVRKRLEGQGSIVLGGTAKDFADYMKVEGERWTRIVRETGAKAD